MDFGDLFQLVIFLVLILAALLGGAKKRARRAPVHRRVEPLSRPPRTSATRPGFPEQAHRRAAPEERAQDELLELLRERLGIPEAPEAVRVPEPEPAEPVSLETLEGAGEESHRRFHERYAEVAPPERAPREPPARRLPVITPRTARQAVIWREVFGPPKSLE